MTRLAYIFAGALAATVLLLVAIARRGAPGPRTPETLEDEAGNLLVASARLRAARLGPNDAHELRHIGAAINTGNSDPCQDGMCTLDKALLDRFHVPTLVDFSDADPRTAELATGGGQEGAGR